MQRNNMSSQPINHTWTRLGYDKLGRVAKDDILKLISSHNTDGEYVLYPGLQSPRNCDYVAIMFITLFPRSQYWPLRSIVSKLSLLQYIAYKLYFAWF